MTFKYDQLKQQLLTKKDQLEAQIKETAPVSVSNVGYGNHMADDASYANEQATSFSLQRNVKGMLAEVKEALKRFEYGTYGVCVGCGQSIDHARLKAIPYTPFCIHCAQSRNNK
jgi:DnaK suppressor protein